VIETAHAFGMACGSSPGGMRRFLFVVSLIVLAMAATACNEEGTVKVRKLEFKGVKAVDESRLKNALATKQSSKLPWGRKNYFDRSRFDADLKRIQAFYADRGFPDARVTGFDVKLNDKQDAVDITLTISEGEPVKVVAVNFEGFDVIPPDHLNEMNKRMPLAIGEPRDRQEVVVTHELAVNELRDHGYPYAKVTTDENDGPDGKSATITFKAEPGPLAHFGPVEIVGNQSVSARVIERQVTYKPGDLYRRSIVQDTQRRLYGMELFQFVNVEALNPEQQSPEVRTRITVAEGKHQRVNFGVGYGTEENGRVDGEYHHVNFLGGARTGGGHARYSSLDRGLRIDFNQPYLFTPHMSFGADAQQWYTYTPAYRSAVTGAKATLTHRGSAQFSWAVSMTSERTSSSIQPEVLNNPTLRATLISLGFNPDTLEQQGTLHAAGLDLQRSTADSLLNAHRGYQVAFHAEAAGKYLPGTYNYTAVSIDGRHYIPVSERLVVAHRVQLGNINAAGDDPAQVPFSKKFFLGGAGSVRGWGRYEISPLSSGLPIAGNALFAFSSEARMNLRGNLGGVLFLDAGNVWADDWKIDLGDLRYAVGPGLRYLTPIGPVRFDFGYQLNPIPGLIIDGAPQKRRWRIHFSIGQAF
jgi:outer membrane protein assembly complex protein YaeT